MNAPHRPPRRPRAWLPLLLASQALVAVAWWQCGWTVGLPLLLASHGLALWGVLAPGARLYGPVLTRLPATAPAVWLTIDDGPSDDTLALLDLLDAHGARATFFLVGERAAARPELVRAIAARGHGIGNHSRTHPQAWFWALGPRRMREEIAGAQAQLTAIAGRAPRWFRAVVGHANPFVHAPLRDLGLARVRPLPAPAQGPATRSRTHPRAGCWALWPRRMREEIAGAQAQLTAIAGRAPRWFRAVVGHANPFVHAPLRDLGLARVAWSAR